MLGTVGHTSRTRMLLWVWAAALAVVAVASLTVIVTQRFRSGSPSSASADAAAPELSWGADARRSPDFHLVGRNGGAVSLGAFRGRIVLLTFIDPLCRSLCPLEAKALEVADRSFSGASRPAIVSVSVNPYGGTPSALRDDASHWGLGPEWRWGLGSRSMLRRVWRSYDIGVRIDTRTVDGVTVHDVTHIEATYVIDAKGFERALFLYPFQTGDIEAAVRHLETFRQTS